MIWYNCAWYMWFGVVVYIFIHSFCTLLAFQMWEEWFNLTSPASRIRRVILPIIGGPLALIGAGLVYEFREDYASPGFSD